MKDKAYISRKEQAVLTKKKIFDTTMLLIRKKSYSKITIREICQSAEISIGTFYLYFLSKDDILLDLYRKMEQDFSPELSSDASGSISIHLSAVLLSVVDQFLIHLHQAFEKDLLQEIYRITLSSSEAVLFSPESPFYQKMYERLSRSAEKCELRADTVLPSLIQNLVIFLQGYIFQWLCDDDLDFDSMKDTCLKELGKYLSFYTSVI